MGKATVALLVSIVGIAIAVAGFFWQVALYRLSGARLQVRLRPALLDEESRLLFGPDAGWGDGPNEGAIARPSGVYVELAEIKVTNIGRSPVFVEGIGLDFGAWRRRSLRPRRGNRRNSLPRPVKLSVSAGESGTRTDLRMDAGDTTSVFADVMTLIEHQRTILNNPPILHVRGTATCAGRHPTLSARRKQWRFSQGRDRVAEFLPTGAEYRAYQQLWRMLQHLDDPSLPGHAWRVVRSLVVDPDTTSNQLAEKLEGLGGPGMAYVADRVLEAYRATPP